MDRKHISRHEKRFDCDECQRKFGSNHDLERHEVTVHQKGRLFTCPDASCKRAGKPFSRRDNLLKHLREVHGRKGPVDGISKTVSIYGGGRSPPKIRKQKLESLHTRSQRQGEDIELSETIGKPGNAFRAEKSTLEQKFHELQAEMVNLRKSHEAELKSLREKHEAELKTHREREERLWDLIRTR